MMEYKTKMKKALRLPFVISLIASLAVIIAFFMPLGSANEEYREYLEEYSQEINVEEIEMTNKEAINVSMYDFVKIYWNVYRPIDKTLATLVTAIIGATGGLSLMALLFVLLKKPIGIFIFNLLTFASYHLMMWDFKDRGVIPSRYYDWGAAYYLYYAGLVLLFAASIYMLVKKIQVKKQIKSEKLTSEQSV